MNLVLIGYRGTGKSAVAASLAGRLSMPVVGMDAEVVRRAGKGVPEIVKERGWEHFRDLETCVAAEAGAGDGRIIDAGGGAILRPQNVEALKRNGVVFWLTADVATIAGRIGGGTERPSLTGAKSFVDEIFEVLAERTPLYRTAADHVIDTVGRDVGEVAAAVAEVWLGLLPK